MSSATEILREYFVKLGFKVDIQAAERVDKTVTSLDKKMHGLHLTILGMVGSLIGMAVEFSSSMDRLYYASQKAGSSAANLKAYEYAGRQIGLTTEAMDNMVSSLEMAIRLNPGMKGFFQSLGINADDSRQGTEIFSDFIDKMREKPLYQGAQFAQMIGMSPDQLYQIEMNLGRFKKAIDERKGMASGADLDQDKAADEGRQMANALGKAAEKLGIATDKIGEVAAPALVDAAEKLDKVVNKLVALLKAWGIDIEERQADDQAAAAPPAPALNRSAMSRGSPAVGGYSGLASAGMAFGKRMGADPARGGELGNKPTQEQDFLDFVERLFGEAPGTLDFIWKQESGRGQNLMSPKGAAGPFGFLSGTAGDVGVKDRYDFKQSGMGAGKYMSQLLERYHGNQANAFAAYNWGMGNMDKYLGDIAKGKHPKMPDETKDYVAKAMAAVGGGDRNITINVNGAQAPAAVASEVARKLDATDQVRYMKGNMR